jgi:hypothetical protein
VGVENQTFSFEHDVRPLFRTKDIGSMAFRFDLSSYGDVRAHAEGIYIRLQAGTMPCDGAWPANKISVFREWIDAGCPP